MVRGRWQVLLPGMRCEEGGSMNCPTCGAPMTLARNVRPCAISEAMNERRRVHSCANGHKTDTIELPRAELQRLRTLAHWARKP